VSKTTKLILLDSLLQEKSQDAVDCER